MRNNKLFLICCLTFISTYFSFFQATLPLPNIPTTPFVITDYGATIGSLDNSAAINATINAASANTVGGTGGTVIIPAGTFLSGPITMQSNVNFYISDGAILRMMPYGNGNGSPAGSYPNNGTNNNYAYFIYGYNLSNIEFSGSNSGNGTQGIIEGDGSAWWTAYNANNANSPVSRPYLIRLKACSTVLITGFTLQNSPNVHICLGLSGSKNGSNGTISNVTILAPSTSPNTDAVDTWYWDNIEIMNCNFAVGDDNVAMDSYSTNINIHDNTFGTGHGVSVGSYATGVNTVNVNNCTFTNTTNGIRLKSARGRGGNDTGFTYTNLTMTGVKYPIYITSWYNAELYPPSSQASVAVNALTPVWNNILFQNITATNSTNAGTIYGLPEAYVNNVTFDNVHITATSRGLIADNISNFSFINCSSITIPSNKGNALIGDVNQATSSSNLPNNAPSTGIDITTGVSTSCALATNEVNATNSISLFPNPVNNGEFTINSTKNIEKIQVYNSIGELVKEQNGNLQTKQTVNINRLTKGVYYVNITSNNGKVTSSKLIKE